MDKDIHLTLKYRDDRFTLTQDMNWWVTLAGDDYEGIIPANYRTDFASIPSIFHWFIGPYEPRIAIPAIIHDYLLDEKIYPRHFCDKIFRKKMIDFGMPIYKAYIAYWCVLIYGLYFAKK